MLVFNGFLYQIKNNDLFNFYLYKWEKQIPISINALSEFVAVTNKMSGKQSKSSLTRTDVRVQTDSTALSEYWQRPRTHPPSDGATCQVTETSLFCYTFFFPFFSVGMS